MNAGTVICRFCLCLRPLTKAEERVFNEGGELPPEVGYKPATVRFIERAPDGEAIVNPDLEEEAVGVYEIEIEAVEPGVWRWEGQGLNTEGEIVASTGPQHFFIEAKVQDIYA